MGIFWGFLLICGGLDTLHYTRGGAIECKRGAQFLAIAERRAVQHRCTEL